MKPFRVLFQLLPVLLLAALLSGLPAGQARSAPAAPPEGWEASRIDDAPLIYTLDPHAAAVDSLGRLHVAFGGDHLYYAVCSTGTPADCSVETVDPQDFVGLNTALRLDAAGFPHIAYFAGSDTPYCDDEQIKYAVWDGNAWMIEQVEQDCVGQHLALALDASGQPAVSYFDDLWDTLQFAERESPGVWNRFTLDGSLDVVGHYSALEYDNSSGDLHIGYLGGSAGNIAIWHQVRSGADWSGPQAVDSSGYFTRLDMDLDGGGAPHFAYHNQSSSELKYAVLNGGVWTTETLFEMAYNHNPAIQIAASGFPHIAFARSSDIGYTFLSASGWSTPESIPASGANPLSLAKNTAGGQPKLVYLDGGVLQFTRRSAAWTAPQMIHTSGDTGLYVETQTAPGGGEHVAYFDRAAGALRYGTYDGTAWSLETVVEDVDINGISLALDTAGQPHIAFGDYQGLLQTELRYIYRDGLAWQERPPLSADGSGPSLALDSSGGVHVAFTEVVSYQNQVTLASWNGSGWDTRMVAASGWNPCLLLDAQDSALISYVSGAYPAMSLNLAVETGPGSWNSSPIDGAQMIGYQRLALDGQGWLHAVYQVDDPNRDWIPRYARQTAGGWQTEDIYSEYGESEPRRMSLLVDGSGNVHVSSQYDNNLYYSLRTAGGWQTTFWLDLNQVYELDLDTGEYSALGLDSRDQPLIAYYGELDLKRLRVADPLRTYYLPMARAR